MHGSRLRIVALLAVAAVGVSAAAAGGLGFGAFSLVETSPKADPVASSLSPAAKVASTEKAAPVRDKDPKKYKNPTPEPAPDPVPEPAPDPVTPPVPDPVTPPIPEPEPPVVPEPPAPEPDPLPSLPAHEPQLPPAPEPDPAIVAAGEIGPSGGIIAATDGDIRLTFPEGAYDTTTTVTVRRLSTAGETAGILRLAGVYSIEPSGELGAPATLAVRYHISVTHFQMAGTLLSASSLMVRDEASGQWTEGAADTTLTAAGYVQGTVTHFSEWTVGSDQPHGTAPEKISYCAGLCHDLSLASNSAIRFDARDKDVCYFCHGAESPSAPPAGDRTGANIQAALFDCPGQTSPLGASVHRARRTGDAVGLWCTSCHDPHKNPATNPGLLRSYDAVTGAAVTSQGNGFCWTCHGITRNRRINLLTPNYWANAGGDTKTTFNGAHSAVRMTTERFDTSEEFSRAMVTHLQVSASGLVGLPTAPVALQKPVGTLVTLSPAAFNPVPNWQPYRYYLGQRQSYDGDPSSFNRWRGIGDLGASAANGWIGTERVTIDLGQQMRLASFTQEATDASGRADTMTILTSPNGSTWSTVAGAGVLGTRLPASYALAGAADARYVRFALARDFTGASSLTFLQLNEVTIVGIPSEGSLVLRPDIARESTYQGGIIRWQASEPASTLCVVEVRVSMNRGATWTAWDAVTNGAALTQIPVGTNLSTVALEVRITLKSSAPGQTPVLDWIEVTTTRGPIDGATPEWTDAANGNQCKRCHTDHGSASASLTREDVNTACTTCHRSGYGGSYYGAASYATSAHASVACTSCHGSHGTSSGGGGTHRYLLPELRQDVCFSCHTTAKQAFDAATGRPAAEYARHDVYAADEVKTGSRIRCSSCHSPHSASGLVDPDYVASPFVAYRDDPTSIPVQEFVIYVSKDTLINQSQPTYNYGSSTQVTVGGVSRALVYFDLNSIPAEYTIKSAVLENIPGSIQTGKAVAVFPVTRPWFEGSGGGAINSESINGASWLEWRYGDNVHTGDTGGGDWTTAGGDRSTAAGTENRQQHHINITSIVRAQREGANYGIMLTSSSYNTSLTFPLKMREYYSDSTSEIRLRVVAQTGPAARQVLDDVAFCLRCHDGTMPLGHSGQSMLNIASHYSSTPHGGNQALGRASGKEDSSGGGGLKAPYFYGMDALPCTTCHDPHGSRLPFHIKESVNGRSMSSIGDSSWGYAHVGRDAWGSPGFVSFPKKGWFCGACHFFPTGHNEEADSSCSPCHDTHW